ncbi:DNA polymerase III subunit chi [Nitrosovibrio sp. Nv17]|uniref:DNA polymerase III subunit chi n=1 Tax=Nitrosovibrio sp. Nv17 TaxID=1855339 RepID=UPI0009087CC4|nr:DNA polymerase III subunit chi [Nitrosovibrio sp. Nv17]SFW34147.1 DNA polymerase III, chi subunit [Nitrosovibrio sp. Nv17]
MTEIDFYSGGGDRLLVTCRLAAKGIRQGLRLMVYSSDNATLDQIDKLLWTFSPTDFVPHCRIGSKLAAVTPLILGSHCDDDLPHGDALVNLDGEHPPFFSRFQRLVEIAGAAPEDLQAARKRYRFYKDRGYEIRHHQLGTE